MNHKKILTIDVLITILKITCVILLGLNVTHYMNYLYKPLLLSTAWTLMGVNLIIMMGVAPIVSCLSKSEGMNEEVVTKLKKIELKYTLSLFFPIIIAIISIYTENTKLTIFSAFWLLINIVFLPFFIEKSIRCMLTSQSVNKEAHGISLEKIYVAFCILVVFVWGLWELWRLL